MGGENEKDIIACGIIRDNQSVIVYKDRSQCRKTGKDRKKETGIAGNGS